MSVKNRSYLERDRQQAAATAEAALLARIESHSLTADEISQCRRELASQELCIPQDYKIDDDASTPSDE